jgi:predicted AlkP superfamily phosphohydrolase/phosphomutase
MSKTPVIVIGLDAADPVLLERWMDGGHLPTLARLREEGAYGRLTTFEYGRAETCNTTFLTGCGPWKHGYWSPFKYQPDYTVQTSAYDYEEFKPFYELGPDYRVAIFDMPQTRLVRGVNGVQVLGWGAHSPRCPSHSDPPELFEEIVRTHGEHPTLRKDDVLSMGDAKAMRRLYEGLATGVERRVSACRALLKQERWDLFLTYFSETHSAQHYFWHTAHGDHPLHEADAGAENALLTIFTAVDRGIGDLIAVAPPDTRVVIFSDHGMETNSTDVPSMVLLPELMYRLSFPGTYGLARGKTGTKPQPVMRMPASRSWRSVLWGLKEDQNPITRWLRRTLPTTFFHYAIERRLGIGDTVPLCPDDCTLGAQPPMWYHPAWPQMKAFALPSFSEGYVRINVAGRDTQGIVDAADYDAACDEVTRALEALRNPRTGSSAVTKVMRTRRTAFQESVAGERLPDADLIVLWRAEPIDVVDHPILERIGPVPFKRAGSHVHRGFLMARGTGITPGTRLPEHHALDVAPTILTLLGAPAPSHFEGQPIPLVTSVEGIVAA